MLVSERLGPEGLGPEGLDSEGLVSEGLSPEELSPEGLRRNTLFYVALVGVPLLLLASLSYLNQGMTSAFNATGICCCLSALVAISARYNFYPQFMSNITAVLVLSMLFWLIYIDVKPSEYVFWLYAIPPLGFLCLNTISGTIVSLLTLPALLMATSSVESLNRFEHILYNQDTVLLSYLIVMLTSGIATRLLESRDIGWVESNKQLAQLNTKLAQCQRCHRLRIHNVWQEENSTTQAIAPLRQILCANCQEQ